MVKILDNDQCFVLLKRWQDLIEPYDIIARQMWFHGYETLFTPLWSILMQEVRKAKRPQLHPEYIRCSMFHYSLCEFSNLGRLRLKVVATDDGQPETKQSSTIVVLTIIRIDNFLMQRSSNTTNIPNTSSNIKLNKK